MHRWTVIGAVALAMMLTFGGLPAGAQEPADEPAADTQPASAPTSAPADEGTDSAFGRWLQKLKDAGFTIPVLGVLSIIAVAFILERLVMLRRGAFVPRGLAEKAHKLWLEGRYDELEKMAVASNSTLGRVLAFVVAHRNAPAADVSVTAGDIAARDIQRHLQRAYPLAVVGTLAPLLGLLGTVSGMVDAFDVVSLAGLGDVNLLGASISKALVTTLVGLVVAIPALFAYHVFRSRTRLFGILLEEEATDLISAWLLKSKE